MCLRDMSCSFPDDLELADEGILDHLVSVKGIFTFCRVSGDGINGVPDIR